ncbi:MAG: DNA polymerase III subunit gamma/tau [Bermanella sp.]
MSYQVLARKWRPQFFKDMVGQEHVMRALINALDNQRLHHAYLFTGTRGVGKTTIARILAKCLNCEQGISSEPCGTCASCVEISEGRFVDLIEVDAASRTKVEDTREILDNVQYAPTRGRYKVYLIDEVHMLSNSSFNALLKTLEEPPPHVKFLLATTDPQKLPATVLSRCLQFSLKNMTPERIVNYLKVILEKETINFEEPGLWLLGKAAEGSMRDALSLTDQSISFGDGEINETDVASMLGTVDRGRVFALATALAQADAAQTMALIAQMAEHAVDFNNLLADLLGLIHRIAIAQAVPDAVDNSQGDKEQVMSLASLMSPAMVQLLYQIALTGKRDLPLAPDPRAGMEMTLLRMLNFAPVGARVESLPPATAVSGVPPEKKPELTQPARQSQSNAAISQQAPAPQVNTNPAPVQPVAPVIVNEAPQAPFSGAINNTVVSATQKAQESPSPIEAMQARAQAAAVPPVVETPIVADEPPWDPEPMGEVQYMGSEEAQISAEQPVPQPHFQAPKARHMQAVEVAAEPVSVAPQKVVTDKLQSRFNQQNTAEVAVIEPPVTKPQAKPKAEIDAALLEMELSPASWPLMFAALPIEGMLRNLVANTCLMQMQGDNLLFHSDAGHMRLFGDNHQQKFKQILNETLSAQYQIQVIEGPWQYETPAQRIQRLQAERQQQAVNSIENDPNVQALRQAFAAQVIMDSITPVDA